MKLEKLMTYRVELKPPFEVGLSPYGTRTIYEVLTGTFEGPRLSGKILSGADSLLIDSQDVGYLDVRSTYETDDGARIYMQCHGVIVFNEKVKAVLSSKGEEETAYGDTHFFIQPRYETGDKRYTWLNQVVTVAEGRILPSAVEFRVFECVN